MSIERGPSPAQRALPDRSRLEAVILPAGCGIILKKGTWHDFPVSCGPPITAFILNTKNVVAALASMPQAAPMDHGDCFKIRLSDHFENAKLKFRDPRPVAQRLGLFPPGTPVAAAIMGPEGYGAGMRREEVPAGWARGVAAAAAAPRVVVVPVVNVEVFVSGAGGPGVQPHLSSVPEVANSGWRDYGNRSGLRRLVRLFEELGLPATAVVNSEAAARPEIAAALRESGWELGAHGLNNSTGNAGLSREEEAAAVAKCVGDLAASFGSAPTTWLTPQGPNSMEKNFYGKFWLEKLLEF